MSTITIERLRERAREKVKSLEFAVTQTAFVDSRAELVEELELARIALASIEADPVAWRWEIYGGGYMYAKLKPAFLDATPLYTSPPAPSFDEDLLHMAASAIDDLLSNKDRSGAGVWADIPAKLRRAAMLQGAVQPQNKQQNIPENIPFNTPCNEAPEHIWLQTAGVWPENGEFSELTWCSDNQHEDDTLYIRADVFAGNSPVIGEGRMDEAI